MAKHVYFFLALCFLISHQCCFGNNIGYRGRRIRYSQQNICQIEQLKAQEPQFTIEAEAGLTEYWLYDDQQFLCVGMAASRTIIQPKGLMLPQYQNSPTLVYVVRGTGMAGVLTSGCPETFQSSQQSQEQEGFRDQHQQIRRFHEGDVIALPSGVAHWCYNDGEDDIMLFVVEHTSNDKNQLDADPRKFLLAGNLQERQQGQHHAGGSQGKIDTGNVFGGFEKEILAEIFGVNLETTKMIQGYDDQRGHIVSVEGELQVIEPPTSIEQEQQQRERGSQWTIANGLEETICSSRLVHNINEPSHADKFNPRAGRLTTLNRFNLPILDYLQLSAQRGILYPNAIKSPNWKQNANTIVYVTRGEGQIQIVDQRGQAVLNEKIHEGQLIVIPQNFAVVTKSSELGFEWISFMTNENTIEHDLAGRTSVILGMPVDVLANAYRISREEARRIKFNRHESSLFEPSLRSHIRTVA